MLLTRKSSVAAVPQSRLARGLSGALARTMDRRAFLKRTGVVAGAGAFASQLPFNLIAQGRGAGEDGRRRQDRGEAQRLYALFGRLCDRRRRAERRLGAAGAGVRLAAQPRRALRQGRVGARARHDRALASPEVPDEAGEGQVPAHLLGPGARRDHQEDGGAPQGVRPRRGLLRRVVQAQQRAGDAAAQVRVAVGHEQLRPPGAHLPLDHRRRRSQHLGLRSDDQLVQRRAELQVHSVLRLERGRGAPGVDAAHAAREGRRARR